MIHMVDMLMKNYPMYIVQSHMINRTIVRYSFGIVLHYILDTRIGLLDFGSVPIVQSVIVVMKKDEITLSHVVLLFRIHYSWMHEFDD